VQAGVGSHPEIEQMSLDDVDLWHLYLDAIDEAELIARTEREDG
jgi:hypothetical protein